MDVNELDETFEPEFAEVPEDEALALDQARAEQDTHLRRAAIGITAGSYKGMVVLPRSAANPLLREIRAEPLPFGGYVGNFDGVDIELHHLDIPSPTCERYWPDVVDFLYGPLDIVEPALRHVGIEPVELPTDFMDAFERGLARYAIYGT